MRFKRKLVVSFLGCLSLASPSWAGYGTLLHTLAPVGLGREPFNGAAFGGTVSVSGDLLVAGGDDDGTLGAKAGTVWSFDLVTGTPQHVLDPPGLAAGSKLPEGLALSGDLAVATSDRKDSKTGEAYLFNARTGAFVRKLRAAESVPGDEFGQAAGVSGNLVLVTSDSRDNDAGAGYLFDATTGAELRKLSYVDPAVQQVGDGALLNGNHALLSCDTPHVVLFDAATGNMRKVFSIEGGGAFGASMGSHGSLAVIGAPEARNGIGEAHVVDLNTLETVRVLRGSDWAEGDEFGRGVAIGEEAILVGSILTGGGAGSVTVFDRATGHQISKLVSPKPVSQEGFGDILATANGRAIVGAERGGVDGVASGVVYVFDIRFETLADVNADGSANAIDMDLISAGVRSASTDAKLDINHDGRVDATDRVVWIEALKHSYFGDSNLDGVFNSGDLVTVFQVGQYEDSATGNSGWGQGDWDGNGDFSSGDLVLAFQGGSFEQGARSAVPAAVPEPSAGLLALLSVPLFALLRRRPR